MIRQIWNRGSRYHAKPRRCTVVHVWHVALCTSTPICPRVSAFGNKQSTKMLMSFRPFRVGNSRRLSCWESRITDGNEIGGGVGQCMTHLPQVGVGQLGSTSRYSGMR